MLRLGEIDQPEIAPNEVLVEVVAAGMDRGTWHSMAGKPYLMRIMGFGFRRPKNRVPGLDVAGTVVAVGSEVTRFKLGDEVFGMSRGSFAEFAAVLEDKLAHKPVGLTFEEAAVVPISGGTAFRVCAIRGTSSPGRRCSSSVLREGSAPMPFNSPRPWEQRSPVCPAPRNSSLSDPSELTMSSTTPARTTSNGTQRYDLILDIGGNNSLSRLRRALNPTGTLVIVGGEEGGNLTGGFGRQLRALAMSPFVGQRLTMLASKERHTDLEALGPYLENGQVIPFIDKVYPLAEVPAAMTHLEAGQARGKIVITI